MAPDGEKIDCVNQYIKEPAMKNAIKNRSRAIASILATAVVAFAGVSKGGGALAAEPVTYSKTVTYGDLNLDSAQGASALYARLRHAAREVCSPLESKELSLRSAWQTCVSNALTSAVTQVNKPNVTALHNQSINRAGNANS
jgi:UrcA family protein